MIAMVNEQMHEDLRRALQDSDRQEAISYREQMKETCSLLGSVLEEKKKRKRIGFGSFIKRQVRFMRWKAWLLQGALIFLLYGIFCSAFGGYFQMDVSYMALFLCCLTVILMLSAAPVLYRSVRYTMYEVELACRFSMVRLLIARVLIIGVGNLAMLGGVLGFTITRSALQVESALLYIILSYLVAAGGFLYMLGHLPAGKLLSSSVGFGSVLIFLFLLLRKFCPAFFTQTFSPEWAAMCVALLAFCTWQMYYFLYRSSYAHVQIQI